ncbi:MAG: glycerophosphodiester phosphodiesterase [Candidatus Nanopelagicales bacterium]
MRIIAHRGASADHAEHTLRAYELAIEQGADGLECDVRLTVDGHLVCVHDRRIDRTSSGSGVVSVQSLAQLQAHDFGVPARDRSWAAWAPWNDWPGWSRRLREWPAGGDRVTDDVVIRDAADRILALPTLLELALSAGRRVDLAIETKHPVRYAGWVEQAVVAQLRRFGLAQPGPPTRSQVQLMSFSAQALRRMRALAPALPRVFLMDRVPVRMREGSLPFGATIAGPDVEIVAAHPGYPALVHAAGGHVHAWTVDDPELAVRCREWGVDAVITNRPAAIRSALR